jgi:hypothetical protein
MASYTENSAQAAKEVVNLRLEALDNAGLTFEFTIKLIKKELRAKKTERLKVKGAVNPDNVGKDRRILATSGTIETDKDGGQYYGDGDTVIEWDEVDWTTRQKARMDLHKLRGDYPDKHVELTGKNGGPIVTAWTNYPPTPETIDEWQKQVEEAEKARMNRQDDTSAVPA